ncbi:MAG: ribonuclease E/G, partial [Actinomycetota bacterium]
IIVIDFIDMLLARNRETVLKEFRLELEGDKTKTQVIGISPLGLVEMTRKNVSEGLLETLGTPCETCAGRGVVIGPDLAPEPEPERPPRPQGGGDGQRPRTNTAAPRRRRRRGGSGGNRPAGAGPGSGQGASEQKSAPTADPPVD